MCPFILCFFCSVFFSFFGLKYGSKSILHPPPPSSPLHPTSPPPPRLSATCTADTCKWHRSAPSKESHFSCAAAAACAVPPPPRRFLLLSASSPFLHRSFLWIFFRWKKIITLCANRGARSKGRAEEDCWSGIRAVRVRWEQNKQQFSLLAC